MSGVLAFVFVLFMMGSNSAKAQFCLKFFNNTNCNIEFEYEHFVGGGTCTTSCIQVSNQTVGPMTRFDIPCNNCNICNSGLRITAVNSIPVTLAQITITGGGSVIVPATGGCAQFTLSIAPGSSFAAN